MRYPALWGIAVLSGALLSQGCGAPAVSPPPPASPSAPKSAKPPKPPEEPATQDVVDSFRRAVHENPAQAAELAPSLILGPALWKHCVEADPALQQVGTPTTLMLVAGGKAQPFECRFFHERAALETLFQSSGFVEAMTAAERGLIRQPSDRETVKIHALTPNALEPSLPTRVIESGPSRLAFVLVSGKIAWIEELALWSSIRHYDRQSPDAGAGGPAELSRVVFLSPDEDLYRAVTVDELIAYAKQIEQAVKRTVGTTAQGAGAELTLGFTLSQNEQLKVDVSIAPPAEPQLTTRLRAAISAVAGPPIREGTIQFQMIFKLWGGNATPEPKQP